MPRTSKLPALMQLLPQEIYDQIFELTFKVSVGKVMMNRSYVRIFLDRSDAIIQSQYDAGPRIARGSNRRLTIVLQKPPAILAVNHATRLLCKASFYPNTTFVFKNDVEQLADWLESLGLRALQCLESVVLDVPLSYPIWDEGTPERQADRWRRRMLGALKNVDLDHWHDLEFFSVWINGSDPLDIDTGAADSDPGDESDESDESA